MNLSIGIENYIQNSFGRWVLFAVSAVGAPDRTGPPAVEFGEEIEGETVEGLDEPDEGGDDDDEEDEDEDDLVEEPGEPAEPGTEEPEAV